MKNIKYYIGALLLTMTFSSCQDWLTVYPNNEQTSDQYWRNKEEVESVLTSGYVKLRGTQERMFIWGESRGNAINCLTSGSNWNDILKLEDADILPTNKQTDWASFYQVINQANAVIKYAPTVKDDSYYAGMRNSHLSEAYFLRALSYFYLVRTFRDVPFVTEPYVTDDYSYDMAKSSEEEILPRLLMDLNSAIYAAKPDFEEKDPLLPKNTKGRATKWAIYSLIADINLWMGNYDGAIVACDSVIRSNKVGLIQATVPSVGTTITASDKLNMWFTNFFPGNTNESIFEVQYQYATPSQPNALLTDWFVSNNRFGVSYGAQLSFDMNELADVRKEVNLDMSRIAKYSYTNIVTKTMRNKDNQNDMNWIIYRFADILLMKAEALIMRSAVTDNVEAAKNADYEAATGLINQIRNRANAAEITVAYNEREMLNMLLTERQCEFYSEGKNWFDLLRIAKRDGFKYKTMLLNAVANKYSGGMGNIIIGRLSDNNALYLPINESELKNNLLLVQNPYYENLGN